jgi:hypothetical protein
MLRSNLLAMFKKCVYWRAHTKPEVTIEWLALLLRTWEIHSNLDSHITHYDWDFCIFPQFLQVNTAIVSQSKAQRLSTIK